jgi:hypothetical protein
MRYTIFCNETKRFIQDDTDILNREGYILGEYAIRPNGEVVFFECTEGGMETYIKTNVTVNLK